METLVFVVSLNSNLNSAFEKMSWKLTILHGHSKSTIVASIVYDLTHHFYPSLTISCDTFASVFCGFIQPHRDALANCSTALWSSHLCIVSDAPSHQVRADGKVVRLVIRGAELSHRDRHANSLSAHPRHKTTLDVSRALLPQHDEWQPRQAHTKNCRSSQMQGSKRKKSFHALLHARTGEKKKIAQRFESITTSPALVTRTRVSFRRNTSKRTKANTNRL